MTERAFLRRCQRFANRIHAHEKEVTYYVQVGVDVLTSGGESWWRWTNGIKVLLQSGNL